MPKTATANTSPRTGSTMVMVRFYSIAPTTIIPVASANRSAGLGVIHHPARRTAVNELELAPLSALTAYRAAAPCRENGWHQVIERLCVTLLPRVEATRVSGQLLPRRSLRYGSTKRIPDSRG